ncbi:MAG: hypothetical protein A3I89_04465 [Candidatus Harrisonbacteria bacterium RIFCSPLOWO2_02_FULL_41_11]|uniref:DUF5667 domain-containing protein n=1 Tax=Candidatus Harrisonbacteria bacterium RIFCSPHIGHO2_02_FULL_42_16 TaxID=1798404 RepID=A0A1G1ZHL1_9BACT|nr:MAG: hypothetical protein A3B92_01465 [Candidatus Harrisonbacteria bacterium RIFCSPHIGHO2_02_FULL_42_16]OGY66426.1 MAG: hypothetical protein A3I89_04465 [Candidatus Harrisonbacteria bacterium RIFCSPLOWO2_02_FULL_41_11]
MKRKTAVLALLAAVWFSFATISSAEEMEQGSSTEAVTAGVSTEVINAVVAAEKKPGELKSYFALETENFQKAKEEAKFGWEAYLKGGMDDLEKVVVEMASDGEITHWEITRLKKELEKYGWARSRANKELAIYGVWLSADDRAEAYGQIPKIYDNNLLGDNKKEIIRKFFVNLTGKDIEVKSDKVARGFAGGWGLFMIIGIFFL